MKNMLSCLLFLKQTNFTNWKQFPQHPSNSDQASVVYEWHQTKTVRFVTAFLLLLCFSKNSTRDSSSIPSYFTVNSKSVNMPVVLLARVYVCFTEPASEIRGRTNVCGMAMNNPTVVKKAFCSKSRAEPHCLRLQNTPVLRITGKAEAMDSFPFWTPPPPKKPHIAIDIPGRNNQGLENLVPCGPCTGGN